MCGIAGYFGSKNLSKKNIKSCLKLMVNRGPDAQNYRFHSEKKENLYFLHTRLSIIDLHSRSNQPFETNKTILIFNGEIYNYLELKKQIKKFYKFKTNSDTEIISAFYEVYGEKCFKFFEGMWSIAIYDKLKKKLVLSRDRFGEKPLYFFKNKDGIYFASEIKVIKRLSSVKFETNLQKIKKFLQFGYKSIFKDNETFFKKIFSFEPSHYYIIKNNKFKKKRYFKISTANKKNKLKNIIQHSKKLFENSLSKCLRSDVPVALCLSGGIDSSMLAAYSKKILNKPLECFSLIDTKDKRYDERDNIQLLEKKLKLRVNYINIKNKFSFSRLKKQIRFQDAPVFTISHYIQNFLSEKIAKKKYKVALSGIAADEIFSGYYDHQLMYLSEVRKDKKLFQDHYKSWKQDILPNIRNKYLKDPHLFIKNKNERGYVYDHNRELKKFFVRPLKNTFKEKKFSSSLLKNRMINEIYHETIPVMTHSEDLNFMQYSIENRSPYLYPNLVSDCFKIDRSHIMQKGYTKYILREIGKNLLPEQLRLDKRKRGFNASINSLVNLNSKQFVNFIKKKSKLDKILNKKLIINMLKTKKEQNYLSKFIFSYISVKLFLDINK